MPSSDASSVYEQLLSRYKRAGFTLPEAVLDAHISELMKKGRTRDEAILELQVSASPWTYAQSVSSIVDKEKEAAEKQIADLRNKIDSLTMLFSKGEVSEETYVRGVKKIENDIDKLRREHDIPTEKAANTNLEENRVQHIDKPSSYSRYPTREPSLLWYIVPFLLGIIGGIVAYLAVQDDDREMANGLLIWGIIWTIVFSILGWSIFLR